MTFASMFGAARFVGALPETRGASAQFRAAFTLEEKPVRAKLTLVGLGFFEGYLNGLSVTDAKYLPLNTDFAPRTVLIGGSPSGEVVGHRLLCPEFDVTALLREGKNVLAVMTGDGWFGDGPKSAPLHPFGGMRMVFSLALRYADGREAFVVSGDGVKTRPGFVTESFIRTGETHDYRLLDDWTAVGYDDSGWSPAPLLAPLETDYLRSDCPPDRVIRQITPELLSSEGGVRLYDCGENISGYPVLRLKGAAGTTAEVLVSERLGGDGQLDEKHMHRQHLTAVSGGRGELVTMHFTWLAFRYFTVTGDADVLSVDVVHMDMKRTSSFRCDNEVLNWLYDAYVRTQLDNCHAGIASDCPHIERLGYTGDGQLTAATVMTVFDAKAFYRKWIGDISDCQDRLTGHVQYTAPLVHCGGGPGGWGCAIVEVPYQYWKAYGDVTPAAELYPQMLRYFDYLDDHSENGLVTSDRPGDWCLGEWITPEKLVIPEPYVNTYFYVKSLLRVSELAPLVGRGADVPRLTAKAEALKAVIVKNYFDPATGDFAGGEQGANCYALDLGLGDGRTYGNLKARYVPTPLIDTGIFGTDLVPRLLFERGDAETAVALLASEEKYSYGHMRAMGATTLWEHWQDFARSDNHPMFGAPVRHLFTYLLGIRQAPGSAAWQSLVIEPCFVPQLTQAEGHVTTPRGVAAVRYKRTGSQAEITVTVPENTPAVLRVAGKEIPLGAGVSRFTERLG